MYVVPDLPPDPKRSRPSTQQERDEACAAMERLLDGGVSYRDARRAVCRQAGRLVSTRRASMSPDSLEAA